MKHKEIYKEYHERNISLEEAWEKRKKLPKPWTTKEWKESREEVVKDNPIIKSFIGSFLDEFLIGL